MKWEKIRAVQIKLNRPGAPIIEVDGIARGSWFVHRSIDFLPYKADEYGAVGNRWTLTQRPTGHMIAYFTKRGQAQMMAEWLDEQPFAEKLHVAGKGRARLKKAEFDAIIRQIALFGGWR